MSVKEIDLNGILTRLQDMPYCTCNDEPYEVQGNHRDTCPCQWVGEVKDAIERLASVAVAAKVLVQSATGNALMRSEETVSESALVTLEIALANAGMDMSDEEFHASLEHREEESHG